MIQGRRPASSSSFDRSDGIFIISRATLSCQLDTARLVGKRMGERGFDAPRRRRKSPRAGPGVSVCGRAGGSVCRLAVPEPRAGPSIEGNGLEGAEPSRSGPGQLGASTLKFSIRLSIVLVKSSRATGFVAAKTRKFELAFRIGGRGIMLWKLFDSRGTPSFNSAQFYAHPLPPQLSAHPLPPVPLFCHWLAVSPVFTH